MKFREVNYQYQGPFTLAEIAEFLNIEIDSSQASVEVSDLMPLDEAGQGHLSFFDNVKYKTSFESSKAQACLVHPKFEASVPNGMVPLFTEEPYMAYAKLAQKFYPSKLGGQGIHETAIIENPELLGKNCSIGANAYIGEGVELGDDCVVADNVSIRSAKLGKNCIIHSGVRIGQDGFGFASGRQGHVKVPQLGGVIIGDDVEIGANTTIDRGSGPNTKIGDGTKIDNLVQIGHNVEIGRFCFVVSQVGIAGSTKIGDFVAIGGQGGVAGHLQIGDGAQIAAGSGVITNIDAGKTVGGYPARNIRDWHKSTIAIERLVKGKPAKE